VKPDDATPAPAAEILPPARMRSLMLMLLTGLALYFCFRLLRPFADVLLWATALAVLFAPLHGRLLARTGKPNVAAAVALAVVIVSVLLPVALVAMSLAAEVSDLLTGAPEVVDKVVENPDARLRAAELFAALRERFPFFERLGQEKLEEGVAKLGEKLLEGSFGLAGKILQAVVRFALIVFTLFFFFRDGERIVGELRGLLPLSRRQADRAMDRAAEVLRASTYGVLLVAVIQGLLGGVMFAVLGLPAPVLWGVVMAFFAMIPMVGPGVVWLPAALILLASGRTTPAIVLLVWGVLVVSVIDNVLRPRLVGSRSRLHELTVFFGVLGGLSLFGLVGLLVGPALLAVAATLLALARERNGAARVPAPAVPT
jgi:predicted PurR-regulated permease PerM